MSEKLSRRRFLGTVAATTVATTAANPLTLKTDSSALAEDSVESDFKTKIHKAAICGELNDTRCETLAKAGFEGMETTHWNTTPEKAAAARNLAEKHGLRIHSVMRGWAEFNHANDIQRQKTIDDTATAIRSAAAYGADTILLVPCRIGGIAMPAPWDFKLDFDPETLELHKVVEEDNSAYSAYIEQQNVATQKSRDAVNSLISLAAELGVVIAIENVWNNLWVKPEFHAAFVRSFHNIWVQTYLDLGNHVKYDKTENWIKACGSTIIKLHCKDFTINKSSPSGGDFKHLHEGDIDWPSVRRELEAVHYNGWMSDETGVPADKELARRMNVIIDGKEYKK
ncbi:MAG: sugar phosphate isomerase/epimerase [Planctomycetaceae bacterium]|jgi:hexulose-6-phosphate isomerase|nr:sugar phosphate isomerase/epimerase [Planctomycetaceae bacterium]